MKKSKNANTNMNNSALKRAIAQSVSKHQTQGASGLQSFGPSDTPTPQTNKKTVRNHLRKV